MRMMLRIDADQQDLQWHDDFRLLAVSLQRDALHHQEQGRCLDGLLDSFDEGNWRGWWERLELNTGSATKLERGERR